MFCFSKKFRKSKSHLRLEVWIAIKNEHCDCETTT